MQFIPEKTHPTWNRFWLHFFPEFWPATRGIRENQWLAASYAIRI